MSVVVGTQYFGGAANNPHPPGRVGREGIDRWPHLTIIKRCWIQGRAPQVAVAAPPPSAPCSSLPRQESGPLLFLSAEQEVGRKTLLSGTPKHCRIQTSICTHAPALCIQSCIQLCTIHTNIHTLHYILNKHTHRLHITHKHAYSTSLYTVHNQTHKYMSQLYTQVEASPFLLGFCPTRRTIPVLQHVFSLVFQRDECKHSLVLCPCWPSLCTGAAVGGRDIPKGPV